MSVYRVHFTWKGKEVVLKAKSLDLTHPYFVSIRDIIFPPNQKIIIDPNEDEVRRTFGKADHFMIPFQTVALIEELKDDVDKPERKIRKFTLVDEDPEDGDEQGP